MPKTQHNWTPTQIDWIRKRWDAGDSTKSIAAKFFLNFGVMITPSAVSGKAHNLDFPMRRASQLTGSMEERTPRQYTAPRKRHDNKDPNDPRPYRYRFQTAGAKADRHIKAIVALCNKNEMGAVAFVKAVGFTGGSWTDYKKGLVKPRIDTLEAMYNVFGKTLEAKDIE